MGEPLGLGNLLGRPAGARREVHHRLGPGPLDGMTQDQDEAHVGHRAAHEPDAGGVEPSVVRGDVALHEVAARREDRRVFGEASLVEEVEVVHLLHVGRHEERGWASRFLWSQVVPLFWAPIHRRSGRPSPEASRSPRGRATSPARACAAAGSGRHHRGVSGVARYPRRRRGPAGSEYAPSGDSARRATREDAAASRRVPEGAVRGAGDPLEVQEVAWRELAAPALVEVDVARARQAHRVAEHVVLARPEVVGKRVGRETEEGIDTGERGVRSGCEVLVAQPVDSLARQRVRQPSEGLVGPPPAPGALSDREVAALARRVRDARDRRARDG